MPKNKIDIPPFPSIKNHEVPAKRQKLDTNSPLISECSAISPAYPSRKLIELRTKLRQTKATRARFHKMIVKVEKDLEEEERDLEVELKAHLETLQRHSQQVEESQASPAPHMSQMKIGTKERIMNLLVNAARMIPPSSEDITTSPKLQDEDTEDQRNLEDTDEKVELTQGINLCDTELEAVERKNRELNSARARQEEKKVLLSRAARANELEEELEKAKEIIATLSAAVKEKLLVSSTQKTLDDAEKVAPLEKILQKLKELTGDNEFGSRDSGAASTALGDKQLKEDLDSYLMKASEFTGKLSESDLQMSQENAEIRRINGNLMAENFELKERMTDMEHQIMELKKDHESLRGTASRLKIGGRGLEPQVALMRIKRDKFSLNVAENVKPTVLNEKCHPSVQKIGNVKTRNMGKARSSGDQNDLNPDSHGDVDSKDKSKSVPETKQGKQQFQVKFGGNWILVSDSRYFKVDWAGHCKVVKGLYVCKKCPKQYRNMNDMKDHVWCEHYGQRFQCLYCEDSPKSYSWQKNIIHHIHLDHPDKCHCRKCC